MANRRSLGDALTMTPDKMAFIQGTPAQPAAEKPISIVTTPAPVSPSEEGEERGEEPTESFTSPRSDAPSRPKSRRFRGRSSRTEREPQDNSLLLGMANLLVPLTTRLQPATAAALKRAGLEQRLRGAQPATVQQIVEIAVAEWLQEHEYL